MDDRSFLSSQQQTCLSLRKELRRELEIREGMETEKGTCVMLERVLKCVSLVCHRQMIHFQQIPLFVLCGFIPILRRQHFVAPSRLNWWLSYLTALDSLSWPMCVSSHLQVVCGFLITGPLKKQKRIEDRISGSANCHKGVPISSLKVPISFRLVRFACPFLLAFVRESRLTIYTVCENYPECISFVFQMKWKSKNFVLVFIL